MELDKRQLARWGITLALCALGTNGEAQSLFGGNRYYGGYDYSVISGLIRLAMIGLSTATGFVIGWFFSPGARELRQAIYLLLGAVGLGIVLLSNGGLSWSLASLMAMIGFFWGIGYWLGRSVRSLMEIPTTFGSAKWADAQHMHDNDLFGMDGILLGRAHDGKQQRVISYKGDRHLLTVAPTRSGKGVSQLVPNLLSYTGSVLVIDPKSENFQITAQARLDMGQDVLSVDPWDIGASKLGMTPARFNPFDWIKLPDLDAPENAMLLADALVVKNSKGDSFWQEEAKALMQGLILLVAFDEAYEGRSHLGTVRDLLLLTGEDQTKLFQYMANSPHALIASTGARQLQKDPKLLANVMASAQAETHMLDSPRLREALSISDFTFEDLKKKPMSVFIILPADRLEAFSRFLRLLVQQAITVNARNVEDKPEKPVLFILDEMPALGRLSMVEQAYGLMAGYGIQLWGVTQDLCQLRRVYGQDYESFIANSGAVAYFGSPDKTSAEYFSSMCGETTVWNFSSAVANAFSSSTGGSGGGSSSTSNTNTDTRAASQRKLAYPDELRRLSKDQQLLLIEDADPIMASKISWYDDPLFMFKGVNTHQKAAKPVYEPEDLAMAKDVLARFEMISETASKPE